MARPLFVAVGVHKAATMPTLPGVLPSVESLTNWAIRHRYDAIRIDDQENPVTVERIKEELTPLDAATGAPDPKGLLDRPRIIVYFCGHGIHVSQDQYWILSAGPNQSNQRISAVSFRDTLATYGPKQVAIISDACRTAQVVQGLASSVVDSYEALSVGVQKDNFFSSQDGGASFSMPSKAGKPAYCIFSKVLERALSEPADPEALDTLYQKLGRKVVSSQSLAYYLEKNVPRAALDVGELQAPQCDPGFRPEINDYVQFGLVDHTVSAADIRAANERIESARAAHQEDRVKQSRSEWRGSYVQYVQELAGPECNHLIENGWVPFFLSSNSGSLKVAATERHGIVVADRLIFRPPAIEERLWRIERQLGMPRRRSSVQLINRPFISSRRSGVAVVSAADVFAAVPFHSGLWCIVIIDKEQDAIGRTGGVELLAWCGRYSPPPIRLTAAEALKGLSARTLNAEDTAILAEDMRYLKHADPMYGIVSAYLYNSIGDVANIRRMCFYYESHGQDVPFDIAMLAQLELKDRGDGGFYVEVPKVAALPAEERRANAPSFVWEETPAVTVDIAGVTPLLRVGWQYIQASDHTVHRKCLELTGNLTEAPISTFQGAEVGARLINILKEP